MSNEANAPREAEPTTAPREAELTTAPREAELTKAVEKSDSEWQACLTPDQYRVMRQKGTERAFTGKYWNEKAKGTYHCAACGQALFSSDTKFDSGTGWPSFWAPLSPDAVATETDYAHGMIRTEALCSRCHAHLGHVFNDGPRPTGMRYCMNSISLALEESEKRAPAKAGDA